MAATPEAISIALNTSPTGITFTGTDAGLRDATLFDFWRWAFSDLCDDDIKGIFAEWMVGVLLGVRSSRRVSWANSDLLMADKRIEVKSSAVWQSWKLVRPDGSPIDPSPEPKKVDPKFRFSGLRARTAERVVRPDDISEFKSDVYVFCLHNQEDPAAWNAWNLGQWEFYVMTREELTDLKIGKSISLRTLRKFRAPMSAAQFQLHMRRFISTKSVSGA
jgi:hypothetical protein